MRMPFTVCFMLVAMSTLSGTQAPPSGLGAAPPDLRAAIDRVHSAVHAGDIDSWSAVVAGEWVGISPTGQVVRKADRIAQMKTQKEPPHHLSNEEMDETIQMVNASIALRYYLGTQNRTEPFRFMQFWIRGAKGWQLYSTQGTAVRSSGGR